MQVKKPCTWGSKFLVFLVAGLMLVGGAAVGLTNYMEHSGLRVTLNDRGYAVEMVTLPTTVKQLLDRYNVGLGPGDEIQPSIDYEITKDTDIKITRAVMVRVFADSEEKQVYLTRGTVQDVLKKAGVEAREDDIVSQDFDQRIYPGMTVNITRIDQETIIEKEPIPYQIISRKNNKLDEGVEKVVQEGNQGELERKILLTYRDGEVVSREVVGESVAVDPVDRVIEKGTVKHFTNSRGDVVRYSKVETFRATAYTHTGNRTRTDVWPEVGMIAVDPKVIPLYTRVYVEFPKGYEKWNGFYRAMDTGSAIKGDIIDVFMETERECDIFGRRHVKIYFLR